MAWVRSWAPGEAAGGMERERGTSQAGQGEDSPAKPLAVTGGTQIPVLPKWGTGPRPGAFPRHAGGPQLPLSACSGLPPSGSWAWALLPISAHWPGLSFGLPHCPLGLGGLLQAGGAVFSLVRRPCQKHLVYKLAAASSRLWAPG